MKPAFSRLRRARRFRSGGSRPKSRSPPSSCAIGRSCRGGLPCPQPRALAGERCESGTLARPSAFAGGSAGTPTPRSCEARSTQRAAGSAGSRDPRSCPPRRARPACRSGSRRGSRRRDSRSSARRPHPRARSPRSRSAAADPPRSGGERSCRCRPRRVPRPAATSSPPTGTRDRSARAATACDRTRRSAAPRAGAPTPPATTAA